MKIKKKRYFLFDLFFIASILCFLFLFLLLALPVFHLVSWLIVLSLFIVFLFLLLMSYQKKYDFEENWFFHLLLENHDLQDDQQPYFVLHDEQELVLVRIGQEAIECFTLRKNQIIRKELSFSLYDQVTKIKKNGRLFLVIQGEEKEMVLLSWPCLLFSKNRRFEAFFHHFTSRIDHFKK